MVSRTWLPGTFTCKELIDNSLLSNFNERLAKRCKLVIVTMTWQNINKHNSSLCPVTSIHRLTFYNTWHSHVHFIMQNIKVVGKPYKAADAGVFIFPNLEEGCPYGGRHLWCQTGRERVATGHLYIPVRYLLQFWCGFEVKFWFPNLEERSPYGVGLRGVISIRLSHLSPFSQCFVMQCNVKYLVTHQS